MDFSLEQFGKLLNNVEPDSHAAMRASLRAVHLAEYLEDGFPLILGNTDPRVGDFELD